MLYEFSYLAPRSVADLVQGSGHLTGPVDGKKEMVFFGSYFSNPYPIILSPIFILLSFMNLQNHKSRTTGKI